MQNWNLQKPDDTLPLAAIWLPELRRYGIDETKYNHLVEFAIDHRARLMMNNEPLPVFGVELLIAMHEKYLADVPLANYYAVEIDRMRELIVRLRVQGESDEVLDEYEQRHAELVAAAAKGDRR